MFQFYCFFVCIVASAAQALSEVFSSSFLVTLRKDLPLKG